MRRWSLSSPLPTTSLDEDKIQSQQICLRQCKLLVTVCVAIIIIVFGIIYIVQQERFFNAEHRYRKDNLYVHDQDFLYNTYIQDVSDILIKLPATNPLDEKSLRYIRTKTTLVLRRLNAERKKDVLIFLYETNLIKDYRLNLREADFNQIELTCPSQFRDLYLPGIICSNAIFINCQFISANFDQANLVNARFINSTLQNASFIETNLDRGHFIRSIILYNDFSGASLVQANFLQAQLVQGNNFTYADLYHANITNDQLEGKNSIVIEHDFRYARFPNGSFVLPNRSENLIINGDAEIDCFGSKSTMWTPIHHNMNLSTDVIENATSWGNCSFVMTSPSRVYQIIDLHIYKLLIDKNSALMSFNAFANCEQSYFELTFHRMDTIVHQAKIYSKATNNFILTKNTSMYQYGEVNYHVPVYTRHITIHFGVKTVDTQQLCYFDNITLTIF
ncbi:unnamed protein product [Adineta ricciae]|uniref:Pentapeptide repeat-containing protein n=1 Tax=Adineta ricciae TaxID=249248 RepID=A0A813Z456_ADIRI|nr:unnamed protein product [Adineta ricciae]CAF1490620.1 unnamed protein product [Adineta ricciae]